MRARQDSLGTVEVIGDTTVLRFHRRLDHPVDVVWQALTDPDRLRAWWGDAVVDLERGVFVVKWLNVDDDGEAAEMLSIVTECSPPNVLQTDGDLHGRLRWQLEAEGESEGEQTLLSFSSTLGLPPEMQTRVVAGWHFHLDALARALDGGTTDLVNVMPLWMPIHDRYLRASSR